MLLFLFMGSRHVTALASCPTMWMGRKHLGQTACQSTLLLVAESLRPDCLPCCPGSTWPSALHASRSAQRLTAHQVYVQRPFWSSTDAAVLVQVQDVPQQQSVLSQIAQLPDESDIPGAAPGAGCWTCIPHQTCPLDSLWKQNSGSDLLAERCRTVPDVQLSKCHSIVVTG